MASGYCLFCYHSDDHNVEVSVPVGVALFNESRVSLRFITLQEVEQGKFWSLTKMQLAIVGLVASTVEHWVSNCVVPRGKLKLPVDPRTHDFWRYVRIALNNNVRIRREPSVIDSDDVNHAFNLVPHAKPILCPDSLTVARLGLAREWMFGQCLCNGVMKGYQGPPRMIDTRDLIQRSDTEFQCAKCFGMAKPVSIEELAW